MNKVIEMPEQPPQLTIDDFQKQIGAMSVQMMIMAKVIERLQTRIKELESELEDKLIDGPKKLT